MKFDYMDGHVYNCLMTGVVEYSSEEEFELVIEQIKQRISLKDFEDLVKTDCSTLQIAFEYAIYRNIGVKTDFLFTSSATGRIVGALEKPSWHGFVHTEEKHKETNLNEWASENNLSKKRPGNQNDSFFSNGYNTKDRLREPYDIWQFDCEREFLNNCDGIQDVGTPRKADRRYESHPMTLG